MSPPLEWGSLRTRSCWKTCLSESKPSCVAQCNSLPWPGKVDPYLPTQATRLVYSLFESNMCIQYHAVLHFGHQREAKAQEWWLMPPV